MRKQLVLSGLAMLCAVRAPTVRAQIAPASAANCHSAPNAAKVSCFQRLLDQRLKSRGVAASMDLLEQLVQTEPVVRDNSHMFAHMLGLAAYTTPAELAKVFSQCSPNFQSGCYHGVIQAYFLDRQHANPSGKLGAAEINGVCRDFRGSDQAWLLFQCVHGLGHGLEFVYSHDLPRSLSGCDSISSRWERSGCYGGAFMENVVSVTNPEQTTEGMSGEMGHDGMPGMTMGPPAFKQYDPSNPQYPCSVLAQRYAAECYAMQTSLILYENGGDFAAASRTCETVPTEVRATCFISLGRDANSYSHDIPSEAAKKCAVAAERFRPWCHVGVAKNLVELTSHPADGFSYCASLTENVSIVSCYVAIGEEINLLTPTSEQRTKLCADAPTAFRDACLYGAQVTAVKPAGLADR
jgi:hypothetical protein